MLRSLEFVLCNRIRLMGLSRDDKSTQQRFVGLEVEEKSEHKELSGRRNHVNLNKLRLTFPLLHFFFKSPSAAHAALTFH